MPWEVLSKGRRITDCEYPERAIRMVFLINGQVVDIASDVVGQAGVPAGRDQGQYTGGIAGVSLLRI